jgi:hypothetical protein
LIPPRSGRGPTPLQGRMLCAFGTRVRGRGRACAAAACFRVSFRRLAMECAAPALRSQKEPAVFDLRTALEADSGGP